MKATPERKAAFCAALAHSGIVANACKAVDINRMTAYRWREDDSLFADEWDRALQIGITALEDEAHRRAFEGVDKPEFYQGAQVATVKEYSDTLAIFLLKAHKPDKYRERSTVDLNAAVANVNVTDETRAAKLAELLTRVAQRAASADDESPV